MEQKSVASKPRFLTWVVSGNAGLCRNLEYGLLENTTLCFGGSFRTLQTAIEQIPISDTDAPIVLIVDGNPAQLGGGGWITTLRDAVSQLLVIALLDDDDSGHIPQLLRLRLSAYLSKPCSTAQLASAVIEAFNGGVSISSGLLDRIAWSDGSPTLEFEKYALTSRERQVLSLLVQGCSVQQIAERLIISYYTADTHLKNIHRKLGEKNSRGVVAKAVREHLAD